MFKNNYSVRTHLQKLFMQRYERYLPTAFDESMSILEKMNKLIEAQNSLIDVVNSHVDFTSEQLERAFGIIDDNLAKQLELFSKELEEQKTLYEEIRDKIHSDLLPDTVRQKLEEWLLNGTVEELINETVFGEINTKLETLQNITEHMKKNVVDFCAVGEDENDDTDGIKDALMYATNNNQRVYADRDFIVSENIDGFMGVDRVLKNLIIGDGSITRDGQTFYLSPKGNQQNVIFVSDNNRVENDGLTRDKPVTLNTALEYLASLGDIVSDGQWVLRFVGTYSGRGFRNFKLPYFRNPLVFEGEVDESGELTSTIDGKNGHDAYFIRADTGSTFQKFFEVRNLKFTRFNRHPSSAGAMVFWDNTDIYVHDCESIDNSRLLWVRNGRLRAFDNKHSGGHSGITVQYHTSFNIEDNEIHNVSSQAVNVGRSSAGHVARNDFKGNNINIEATQSSRLRTIENVHHDWGYRGVNLYLNATWEGAEDEIIEYDFPRETPFYEVFYGSSLPITQRRTTLNRHVYDFPPDFYTVDTRGYHDLNAKGFQSPIRMYDAMLKRETTHIKIQYLIQSSIHATDPGIEFEIILSQSSNPDSGFLTIPISSDSRIVGEIEVDLYARRGSHINYCFVKYHDGEGQKSFYRSYGTANLFNKGNTLSITRTIINSIKGEFNVMGIISDISQ